jgi:hypothetical protein
MDPTYSTMKFYQHLLAVAGWQQLTVNDAAQAVERSGFPDAYAQHQQAARDMVNAVQGAACSATGTSPNTLALCAVTQSTPQSGLQEPAAVQRWWPSSSRARNWANPTCGVAMVSPASTALGSPTPPTPQPASTFPAPRKPSTTLARCYRPHLRYSQGISCFYGNGPRSVTHVGIAISPTQMIDAPNTGSDVEIIDAGHLAASRPAASTAS